MHFALQSLLALFGKATYSSFCSCIIWWFGQNVFCWNLTLLPYADTHVITLVSYRPCIIQQVQQMLFLYGRQTLRLGWGQSWE